ncbi:MAG: hypothetical protein P4L43_16720 [Syntrophobacteraceae bacterium]|nr:hypothetical protein [Syntrophobacteraceae bacterium]
MREFAKKGAWIGLLARDGDRLEAAREEVEKEGGRAKFDFPSKVRVLAIWNPRPSWKN